MGQWTCVCVCARACISVWEYESKGNESRCNNMGGGREHEGGQIQQLQVTGDHRLAGIPRLPVPSHYCGSLLEPPVQSRNTDLYYQY